jgi:glycine cleavage system aminomethyltransferase T
LGQEIVERVRSRAQIHRVLLPVRIRSSSALAPGTKLMADGKDVAEITSSAYSPAADEVVALAYVRTEAAREKAPMTVKESNPPINARVVASTL